MNTRTSFTARVLALALCLTAPLIAIIATTGCSDKSEAHTQYHCPMHPTYVADAPGECPICGMALVLIAPAKKQTPASVAAAAAAPAVDGGAAKAPTPSNARRILFYRSPMNPDVTSPMPTKDEMGMDYIPVYSDEAAAPEPIPGRAEVSISEEGVALAGVVTAAAELAPMTRVIRTVGTVVPDETRVRHVHTKISGWVEKLFVGYTGQSVRKGEPILSIFSPELVASQEEFLQARSSSEAFGAGASADARAAGESITAASRRRLELLDVPRRSIDALERGETPKRSITLTAPASGFVTAKQVFPGQQVDPETELFTVTDLSRVWVEAAIYENEASLVRLGQRAVFTFPYDRNKRLESTVSYIFPYLDTDTRTQKIRFDFENPELALKPGMFVDVDLEVQTEQGVVIPDSAIIDTGERQIVYAEVGPGRFAPRLVEIGTRDSRSALVLSGLSVGERVVTKGNFLIDSESRIRAAVGAEKKP